MEYLISLILLLFGGLVLQTKKKNIAEARNDNLETKEKLNDVNKNISQNQGQIESEEDKQKEILKEIENGKNSNDQANPDNLLDYFRNRKG